MVGQMGAFAGGTRFSVPYGNPTGGSLRNSHSQAEGAVHLTHGIQFAARILITPGSDHHPLSQDETFVALRRYFRTLSPIGGSGVGVK